MNTWLMKRYSGLNIACVSLLHSLSDVHAMHINTHRSCGVPRESRRHTVRVQILLGSLRGDLHSDPSDDSSSNKAPPKDHHEHHVQLEVGSGCGHQVQVRASGAGPA